MPENMRIDKKYCPKLVKEVEKPSNINWENLDATNCQRCTR